MLISSITLKLYPDDPWFHPTVTLEIASPLWQGKELTVPSQATGSPMTFRPVNEHSCLCLAWVRASEKDFVTLGIGCIGMKKKGEEWVYGRLDGESCSLVLWANGGICEGDQRLSPVHGAYCKHLLPAHLPAEIARIVGEQPEQ